MDKAFLKDLIKMENIQYFSSRAIKCKELSNFSLHNVIIDNINYPTGEHAFHGEKFRQLSNYISESPRKEQLLNYSLKFRENSLEKKSQMATPQMAKSAGGKKGLLLTIIEQEQWNQLAEDVQLVICMSKLELHHDVQKTLLATGDQILIHSVFRTSLENIKKKEIWGGKYDVSDNIIYGQNKLGKIWMKLRN